FNAFLDVYNSKIRGGKLGTYSWNPDNYKCSKELNCGGYFLITFQALMGEHILEGYTEDIAKEMKKGIGDCDHFAFELAGNPSQYDEALEGSGQGSEGNDECTEEDFTSDKDKNCYVGPDGKCYEDPGTTYCSGMTQSRNPYLPCYLEPEVRPTTTPTPQACLGASCTIDPTPIPDSTPQPRSCLGSHCEPGRIDDTAVLAATPRVQTCVGSNCTPMPTPTPAAIDPTPIPCSSAAGGSMTNPCVLPTIVPTIATQPTEILCAGTISAGGICSVPVKTESPPATATPLYCNGKTQSNNPKAPCYIAPSSF
ncbi:MAG: hypothetical protein J0M12_05770, partial [Deltaproteobacteria bacterium]|nr:hypothetical protein [Deltaproteobacteria bacterium]